MEQQLFNGCIDRGLVSFTHASPVELKKGTLACSAVVEQYLIFPAERRRYVVVVVAVGGGGVVCVVVGAVDCC